MINPKGHIDTLLKEERVFRPSPFALARSSLTQLDVKTLYQKAAQDPLAYWEEAAQELEWFDKWDRVLDDANPPFYRWFPQARCNIVHNALKRHTDTEKRNKLALIWEGESGEVRKYTFLELYRLVCSLSEGLRTLGIGKGDLVLTYLPAIPENVISILAIAAIGAVHCPVFAGYSAKALKERILDVNPKAVITADGFYRNGRLISLKAVVDEALEGDANGIERVITVSRAGGFAETVRGRDLRFEDLVKSRPRDMLMEPLPADAPLFLLHTSGSYGRPKAVIHTHGGYMVGVNKTFSLAFDPKPTDILWTMADPGWITGHSYMVYAPLLAGVTTLLYEGHPLYPRPDRMWDIISRHGVSLYFTVPTIVRMALRYGLKYPRNHDLTDLRLIASTGEPLDPETWMWLYKHLGRSECPIIDTWWQTETGHFMICPLPATLLKPGSVGRPLPGIDADVCDFDGNPVPPGKGGYLVVRKPWPGMPVGIHNNRERYVDDYFGVIPGIYFAGDVAARDEDGYIRIQGRADEVLNIAGHRIGTAELESALASHESVAEVAVVGAPDEIRGESALAFVVLREGFESSVSLGLEIKEHVRRELGPVAVVREVRFMDSLPKTRSGKIKRKALKEETGAEEGR